MVNDISAVSTCKRRKVGAVLTDENFNIISCGYNHVCTDGCCKRHDCESGSNLERCNAIHAEMLAVLNKDIKGKKLFVNLFPCPVCTKYLALSGLSELYYYEDYNDMTESAMLLLNRGVKLYKYKQDGSVQEVKLVVNDKKEEVKKKYFGE